MSSDESDVTITPPQFCNCPLCKATGICRCSFRSSSLKVAPNAFPYDRGALLLISDEFRHQREVSADDLACCLYFQSEFADVDSEEKRLYLFVNQLGAGASIDHLHIQGVFLDGVPLPIEVAPVEDLLTVDGVTIARLVDYVIYGLSIYGNEDTKPNEIGDVAQKVIQIVDEVLDTPYNLSISRETIRIIPRRARKGYEVSEFLKQISGDQHYAQRVAGLEVSGMLIVSHRGLFAGIETLFHSSNSSELLFRALKGLGYIEKQQKRLEEELAALQ